MVDRLTRTTKVAAGGERRKRLVTPVTRRDEEAVTAVRHPHPSAGGNHDNGRVSDNLKPPTSMVRVRLFGQVDVEGEQGDPSVKLRPLSRRLLARLALEPSQRLDTEDLAKLLVIGVDPGVPVAPDKLSSAQQQLRNAQWELRKRLGEGDGGAELLGSGRRWVALEGAQSDYREFLRAADGGDRDRARAIASRGELLAGIDDPWAAPHRRAVEERLGALGHGAARGAAGRRTVLQRRPEPQSREEQGSGAVDGWSGDD